MLKIDLTNINPNLKLLTEPMKRMFIGYSSLKGRMILFTKVRYRRYIFVFGFFLTLDYLIIYFLDKLYCIHLHFYEHTSKSCKGKFPFFIKVNAKFKYITKTTRTQWHPFRNIFIYVNLVLIREKIIPRNDNYFPLYS